MGKPVKFGFLAQVMDNPNGAVVDQSHHIGNPADGPLLAPAVGRVKTMVGRAPKEVTADRGYGGAKVDADLTSLGARLWPSCAKAAGAPPGRRRNVAPVSATSSSGAPVPRAGYRP